MTDPAFDEAWTRSEAKVDGVRGCPDDHRYYLRMGNREVICLRGREDRIIDSRELAYRCHAARDGDCAWSECPQLRDGEPGRSGRSCPLWQDEEDEW